MPTIRKASEATALTGANVASGDKIFILDVSDTTDESSGTTKAITAAELLGGYVWLMSSHKNEDETGATEEKLRMWASVDGKYWNQLSADTLYTSPSGSLRDPSLILYGGRYYVCFTPEGADFSNRFAIAYSDDLLTWTHLAYVDLSTVAGSPATTHKVWAPEWFLDSDGTLRVYVSIGPGSQPVHAIYEVHATNAGLTTWSNPVLVLTEPSEALGCIDAFVHKVGSTYYMWFVGRNTQAIGYATSSSATSGFTIIENGDDWAGWGTGIEGPTVIQIDDDTWRIYFDKFDDPSQGLYYSESSDSFATWTEKVRVTVNAVVPDIGANGEFALNHPGIIRTARIETFKHVLGAYLSNKAGVSFSKTLRVAIGNDVASTASMTLGDGNFFTITGTADITSIAVKTGGTRVTLLFSGTAASVGLTDGSNLKLAGNFGYTPNDTIDLICDGTNWFEISRSVN